MFKSKNELSHEEMVKIVRSEEVKELIEKELKDLDKDAFTETGKIKSYKVEEKKIKWNPMGAIMVYMYINDDEDLKMDISLDKRNGEFGIVSLGYSMELKELLKEENINE